MPSPSPTRTPLRTRGNSASSVYSASIWERRRRGRSSGARGVVQSVVLAHWASTLSAWTSSCSYPSRVYLGVVSAGGCEEQGRDHQYDRC